MLESIDTRCGQVACILFMGSGDLSQAHDDSFGERTMLVHAAQLAHLPVRSALPIKCLTVVIVAQLYSLTSVPSINSVKISTKILKRQSILKS